MCKSSNINLHTNRAVSFGNTFMGAIINLKHECFCKCLYKFLNILIKSLKHFQGWYEMLCWKIHVYVYSFHVKLGNTWNSYIQYLFVYQGLCMVSKPRQQNMQKKKKKTVLLKILLIQIQEWAVYYMGEGIKNGSILQYSKQYAVSKKMTPLFVKIDHMNQNFTDLHYVYYCLPLYCIPTA